MISTTRNTASRLVPFFAVVSLLACSEQAGEIGLLPSLRLGNSSSLPVSLLSGTLERHGECIGLRQGDGFRPILWREPMIIEREGVLEIVRSSNGRNRFTIGQAISGTGGSVSIGRAKGEISGPVPPSCGDQWIVLAPINKE